MCAIMKKFKQLFVAIVCAICCSTFVSCDELFYDEIVGTWECYTVGSVGFDDYEYLIVTTYTRSGDYYLEYEEWINGRLNDSYTASGYYECWGSKLEVTYWIDGTRDEIFESVYYDISGDKLLLTYSNNYEELYIRY